MATRQSQAVSVVGLRQEASEKAGINPSGVYFTDLVKHFKWEPGGSEEFTRDSTIGSTGVAARCRDRAGQAPSDRAAAGFGSSASFTIDR